MKKIMAMLIAFVLFLNSTPVFALLSDEPLVKKGYTVDDVCALAKNEGLVAARERTTLWIYTGLLLPGVGSIMSCFMLPPIPEERLNEKSPNYINAYKNCFEGEARGEQFDNSMYYLKPILVIGAAFLAFYLYSNHK